LSGLRGSLLITCLSKIYVIIVGQVKNIMRGSLIQKNGDLQGICIFLLT